MIAAVAVPKLINLRDDAATAAGSEILASAHDGVNLYRSGCLVRGGDIEEPRGDDKEQFEIDGIRSSYSGSCYPALDDRRNVSNARQCFEMFNTQLSAGQLDSITYNWNSTGGSSNGKLVSGSWFTGAQDAGYQLFIHQAGSYHSYCHFYFIDGTDLSQTPYLFVDGDTGRMAMGVTDVTSGINWDDSLKLY